MWSLPRWINTSHKVLFEFYENLIGTDPGRPTSLDLQFYRESMDLLDLDNTITEEEVWGTIKSLPSDRAPGLDGFTGRFYKTYWELIKADVMAAIITVQQRDSRGLSVECSLHHSHPKEGRCCCCKRLSPHQSSAQLS